MERKDVEELCKKIHLDNAKMYFKTNKFKIWVDDVWDLAKQNQKQLPPAGVSVRLKGE